jgi:hypothetical protein
MLECPYFWWHEWSEDWLWSVSLHAVGFWIVKFSSYMVVHFFVGTFLDLPGGILYSVIVCCLHFYRTVHELFLIILYTSLLWQLAVQAVILIMMFGFSDRLLQKYWWCYYYYFFLTLNGELSAEWIPVTSALTHVHNLMGDTCAHLPPTFVDQHSWLLLKGSIYLK